MPLSEHVYCVAVTFKMTERIEQEICTNFVLSMNIPLQKLFRWFRRPKWWATGNWQLHHTNAPAYASHLVQSFFGKTSNHPGDSAPLQPRLGALWLLACPKTKSPFQTIDETQENMTGQLMAIGRTVWGPKVNFKGNWGIIVVRTMFLIFCIFFKKCLYFSYYMSGYLLDRPCIWRDGEILFPFGSQGLHSFLYHDYLSIYLYTFG